MNWIHNNSLSKTKRRFFEYITLFQCKAWVESFKSLQTHLFSDNKECIKMREARFSQSYMYGPDLPARQCGIFSLFQRLLENHSFIHFLCRLRSALSVLRISTWKHRSAKFVAFRPFAAYRSLHWAVIIERRGELYSRCAAQQAALLRRIWTHTATASSESLCSANDNNQFGRNVDTDRLFSSSRVCLVPSGWLLDRIDIIVTQRISSRTCVYIPKQWEAFSLSVWFYMRVKCHKHKFRCGYSWWVVIHGWKFCVKVESVYCCG